MTIITTPIKDLLILEPRVFEDDRGYFYETFNNKTFKENGLDYTFVQSNESYSTYGTIRGLHFQKGEYAQAKLVRVVEGEVLDVAVDLREESDTYGMHFAIKLSGENKKQLLIPRGFAHGFSVLSETAIFSYQCDNYYNKNSEGGINYADPFLDIDWLVDKNKIAISVKDMDLNTLQTNSKEA